MDNLEKKIRENRESFDAHLPSEGHFERFRGKLYTERRGKTISRIPEWLKIAAVLLIVAGSSILVFENVRSFIAHRQSPLQELLPGEYIEAQIYYTSEIREKYSEIGRLNSLDPEGREILLKELEEMDRMFNSLMKDLQTNPTDERILSAMIHHYQIKLEVMGEIIDRLEKVNQINSTYENHENKDV
jgi:hypothetical protein